MTERIAALRECFPVARRGSDVLRILVGLGINCTGFFVLVSCLWSDSWPFA